MPHHTVAIWAAREDEAVALRIAALLRGAGLQPFSPVEVPGGKLHRLAWQAAHSYDRLILVVSAAAIADGHVANVVSMVERREFDAGAESFILSVDVDGAIARIRPTDPLGSLSGRVSLPSSATDEKLLGRLLAALTAR